MPIQLIDNFNLNVQKPIDNRVVVGGTYSATYGGYSTRYDIENPYQGLRIWDLNDGQPYVFIGTTWSSEASATTIQGSGTASYVPLFNTSNSLSSSSIYETSGNILIGTTTAYPFSPTGKLQVNGVIRSLTGGFYGDGTNLTALDASNISTGSLNLARITVNGSSGYVMTRNSSSAQWQAPSDLSVGTASNAQNVSVSTTTSAATHYLLFSSVTSGTTQPRLQSTSPGGIAVVPSKSQILVPPYYQNPPVPQIPVFSAYGAAEPPYSFNGDSDTGIYSPESNSVSISSGGSVAMTFGPTYNTSSLLLRVSNGTEALPSVAFSSDTNTGIYRVGSDEMALVTGGSKNIGIKRVSGSQSVTFYSTDGLGYTNFRVESGGDTTISVNAVERMKLTSSGIQMMSSLPTVDFYKTTSADRYVTNFVDGSTGLSATTFSLASVTYDRLIYVYHNTTGTGGAIISVETTGGLYQEVARINESYGYATTMAIIPSGKQFKIYLMVTSGTPKFDVIMYKFGK